MNTPHQEPSDAAAASASAAPALGPDELDEINTLLDDLRTRGEEIPQWEFCDGFLTALICSRRPIPPSEYLPMLLGDGAAIDLAEDEPLPLLPAFADAAQQRGQRERQRQDAEVSARGDHCALPAGAATATFCACAPRAFSLASTRRRYSTLSPKAW